MQFKAGDLIFKRGTGVIPFIIRLLTRSKWSHVVVCINSDWVIEATYKKKVRVVPICEFINKNNIFGYRDYLGDPVDTDTAYKVLEDFLGKNYQTNFLDLLGTVFPCLDDHREEINTVFCSELVVYYLQGVGVLGRDKLPDSYTPEDLASGGFDGAYSEVVRI